mmetsp:Transcript_12174/g.27438  ORF Transcript_12174/g.27438 Transcript_12174/m.27438 type:complete len:96 (+) Transcript_12174:973-1260(+)
MQTFPTTDSIPDARGRTKLCIPRGWGHGERLILRGNPSMFPRRKKYVGTQQSTIGQFFCDIFQQRMLDTNLVFRTMGRPSVRTKRQRRRRQRLFY